MTRILSLLLILTLLPLAAFALAEEAPAASLPQVGDVVNGFRAVETRDFPLIGGTAVLFEHERTGALLMYLANEDTNRVFDLTFKTRAIDNTGLPHVFEHSTLDGSEKYPSKALFFNLSSQTYNTFMNAFTYPTMTSYPVASLSEDQLLKYADYYTDSCLNPTIMEDESIFREEAWRYRLADRDAELTIEGTVYSEMLGATTLERQASFDLMRAAFPGSTIGNDPGGAPADIPSMTYESLKAYHDLYYHPSNLIAYLYGDFEDYTAFLKLLDEAFAPFEKQEFTFEDADYTPITGSVTTENAFPVEAGSDTQNVSTIYYVYLCPGLNEDSDAENVVDQLTNLMSADGSQMRQNLEKALPTASCGCYVDVSGPEDMIVFVCSNVNPEDAETFRAVVDQSIAQIAEEGFPAELVDSLMAELTLTTALLMEESDVGVNMVTSVAYSYANSGDPFSYIDSVESLSLFDERNGDGTYIDAINTYLTEEALTVLSCTYPAPGLKEENDQALKDHLAEVKASMSDEELDMIIARSNATEDEADDASQYVKALQVVTVESLPEDVKLYDVTDETGEDGVRHLTALAAVDGIGRADIWLDAAGLSQEDLLWFHLFTTVVGEMDTDQHTHEELDTLTTRYLYDADIRLSITGRDETSHMRLRLGWTAVEEDFETGYDLMYELLFKTDLTNVERLKELVGAEAASLKSRFKQAPYALGLYRGLALYDETAAISNYYSYLDYYDFINGVTEMLDTEPDAVVEKLVRVQAALNNRFDAITAYAGTEEGMAQNRVLSDQFLAKLNEAPVEEAVYDLPKAAMREGIIVDGGAQFNGYVLGLEEAGIDEYDAALDAVTELVYDAYLLPKLRDQYGAYGVLHGANENGVYVMSYRDPNVKETFQVYAGLGDFVRNLNVDQATLDGYIQSAYVGYAMPTGELSGAMSAITQVLSDREPDENLTNMRALKALKADDVNGYADMYDALVEKGYLVTVGSASVVNENAELYDAILDPLGAKDMSALVLEDVPDDDPAATAVHYVLEMGLMLPESDTAFGAEEPATAGELAAALYALIGGDAEDVDGAIETLTSYSLFPADVNADDVLSDTEADELLAGFSAGVGLEYEKDVTLTGEALTKAELAGVLMVYMEMIEEE